MVMVVDDEPMIRRLVASALSTSGYCVVDAASPQQAIRMLDSHPGLALLVTDVVMPEVDGCKLAEQMRLRMPGLKVLFMSGFEPGSMTTVSGNGVGFLQKPFRVAELVARVRQMLQ
jgi:DNA-binding response OmpR family regulator